MHLFGKQHKKMSQKLDIQKKYASLANPSVDPLSGVSNNASSYTVDARGQKISKVIASKMGQIIFFLSLR